MRESGGQFLDISSILSLREHWRTQSPTDGSHSYGSVHVHLFSSSEPSFSLAPFRFLFFSFILVFGGCILGVYDMNVIGALCSPTGLSNCIKKRSEKRKFSIWFASWGRCGGVR